MNLIICGNGFDLHHGYKTGYNHYRDFLIKNYSQTFKSFENFKYLKVAISNSWSELEESLAIKYDECIDDAVNEYYPNLNDESDSRWHGIDIEINSHIDFVFNFTGRYFLEWLSNTNFLETKDKINLSINDLYINFNYTNTLQNVYKINDDKIFHIHGNIDNIINKDTQEFINSRINNIEIEYISEKVITDLINNNTVRQEIQFGSVENNNEKIKKDMEKKYKFDEFYYASIEPGIRNVIRFCDATSKNISKNYDPLKSFINKDIEEVIVMGHSIMGVDFPYYSDVIVPALKNRRWVFYWYSEEDWKKINIFIKKLSLSNYSLVKW